jgi:alpha-glucosidase (family GH31 glycosyl hydrolase)
VQKFILNALARNVPRGHERDDERALAEYEEAKAKGYLAHPNVKWWFGAGGMFDFANRQAADWWNRRLRPLYEQGIAFIKNDDGEYLPPDAASSLGMNGREYHNLYGFFYSRALYEGQAALDDRRPFIYARSAWVGSQRFPALFLGDQQPTFAHLQSTLRAGLNMSLLGFAYWTADVFGLDGKTTPETHMRYAQWALMVSIARYFWRPPAIDDTRFPWSHHAQVEANFRKYADLRYRLLPYYYALAWEAYQTAGIYDQVMLGECVMLAPVVEPGATTRTIVLPPGTWYDFWSEQSYAGGREIVCDAPLDCLPILVRGGCILPMGPSLTHIADDHRFDQLTLHCYPPYPAQCVLYDDDGLTRAYQRGDYALTHATITSDQHGITVHRSSAQGNLGRGRKRRIEMVLHHCQAITRVQVNQQAWADWSYLSGLQQGSVVIEGPIDHALTIQVFFDV